MGGDTTKNILIVAFRKSSLDWGPTCGTSWPRVLHRRLNDPERLTEALSLSLWSLSGSLSRKYVNPLARSRKLRLRSTAGFGDIRALSSEPTPEADDSSSSRSLDDVFRATFRVFGSVDWFRRKRNEPKTFRQSVDAVVGPPVASGFKIAVILFRI